MTGRIRKKIHINCAKLCNSSSESAIRKPTQEQTKKIDNKFTKNHDAAKRLNNKFLFNIAAAADDERKRPENESDATFCSVAEKDVLFSVQKKKNSVTTN